MSGAGRTEIRRSHCARRARSTTACGSNRYATRFAAPTSARSPNPSRVPGSAHSSASTLRRSATDRHAVSRTSNVARHSESRPALSAARVCGISAVNARANPR